MAFENSPSLKEFEDGIPQKLSDPSARRKRIRTLVLLLVVLLLFFVAVSFAQSDTSALLAGKGSLSGQALDDSGQPFQGYIFVLGTDIEAETNAEGDFFVDDVPAGTQTLILANEYAGYEFPVVVAAGETVDIGEIQFISTAVPEE
ncbi:MAG: carboxypeptidase regulatory-like domain-containing protein [Anaerolineae bacterium]|jgi:hypothetical protein|nr:carboxypeptidase regulatory-like domain-containing protein [Anaerolineae bacterium]MBT7070841.1 carboxypeptidase regulatory-like domain-containing protein [Anaerolineae bacterium]MBT7325422.1 carboxypeptidase regulatory-like domain-containing protein [Anaerolineae bacterium]